MDGILEKINRRLGLIPKKDIEDKRLQLVEYYNDCKPYLTDDMKRAINAEDIAAFGDMVSALRSYNPDNTVARSDPGWNELFSFEIKFKEYLEMKNKNVKTEDVLRELEQPERVRGQRR